MSQSEFVRFLADLKKDPALSAQFQKLSADRPAMYKLARDKGYNITAEDAIALEKNSAELTEADLEKVAGGWSITCDTNTLNPTFWGCPD